LINLALRKKNFEMGSIVERLKHVSLIKKIVFIIAGIFSYPGLALINKFRVTGTENLEKLPKTNVLFVSNHQTYFADVIAMYHVFSAVKWGKRNKLGFPYYLLNPFTRVNYVGAEQTLKKTWLARFFGLAGGITVKRTWNAEANESRKGLDPSDTRKILRALEKNWVITFPQGTTTAFAPGRKGTALIIRQSKPIVIPVVVNGFREAFDKKGLRFRKKGTVLSVHFKEPMQINYEENSDILLEQLMDAIEQSEKFKPKKLEVAN
jgi:1-acyl-sn-glycerol-3-phosphate acyltransferase